MLSTRTIGVCKKGPQDFVYFLDKSLFLALCQAKDLYYEVKQYSFYGCTVQLLLCTLPNTT